MEVKSFHSLGCIFTVVLLQVLYNVFFRQDFEIIIIFLSFVCNVFLDTVSNLQGKTDLCMNNFRIGCELQCCSSRLSVH